MENKIDSKQKILKVAEKIFAEKGFDGARVSEIASEAGVNKALIYYYFDGKEDILESLFSTLVNDFIKLLNNNMMKIDNFNEENFDQIANNMLNYILSKEDILRIAMTESMKTSSEQSIILKISEMLMSAEIDEMRKSFQKKGMDFPDDVKELYVAEFFTGSLPFINYVIFKDEFISHFNLTEEEYREFFIRAFRQTHVAYHLRK